MKFKLNNSIEIPAVGLGTWKSSSNDAYQATLYALKAGYRHIDTAMIYGNEVEVGQAVHDSGINRKDVFITSKVWNSDQGFEETIKACNESLQKLNVDYLDLYLIHRPRGDVKGTWKAMEELMEEGKIRAIGVSNFEPNQIDELMGYAKIKPAINQIETHVFFQQHNSYKFLNKSKIQIEAWSPFAAGRNGIFNNQTLAIIGKKYLYMVRNHQDGYPYINLALFLCF